jgi:Reverse transcriptase (RNA-dependent DNA polymerase)
MGSLRQNFGHWERSAQVAKEASVKIFLPKAAVDDMELRQIDILSAYLNAALKDRLVYVKQPTGFDGDPEMFGYLTRP